MCRSEDTIAKSITDLRSVLLMFKYGVYERQDVTSTEGQQQNTARVQLREAVHPSPTPPGHTVTTHVGIEVPYLNKGVPSWNTFQRPR